MAADKLISAHWTPWANVLTVECSKCLSTVPVRANRATVVCSCGHVINMHEVKAYQGKEKEVK